MSDDRDRQDTLVVYPPRLPLFFKAVASLLVAAVLLFLWTDEATGDLWRMVLLFGGFLPLSFIGAISLVRFVRPLPALVVDAQGITDNASLLAAGRLMWDEIEDVFPVHYIQRSCLAILPKNVDRFLRRMGWFKRLVYRNNLHSFNAPIIISEVALTISLDAVLAFIEQFRQPRTGAQATSNELSGDRMTTAAPEGPQVKKLPSREEVPEADRWDLSSLYLSDEAWEADFKQWEAEIPIYAEFQGRLGESAAALAECLRFDSRFDRSGERLGTYAFLKTTEDTANSTYQGMQARYMNAASRAGQAASYIRPEIMAIPDERMQQFLADKELDLYRLQLQRLLRYKPHTLSDKEEKLLAMQTEMADAANQAFRQLNNADLKFGTIKNDKGELIELSHATFSTCLHSPDREVRRTAFHQYYEQFKGHENTLTAILNGSIQRDIYYAKARGYESALAASLFHDDVPSSVYDNLIQAVRSQLPAVHRYYDLRRRLMGIDDIHHYDTYVPILADLETHRTWDDAVELTISALEPLGSEYCGGLEKGLRGRWSDRYENQGKQSGAFSCGSYDGDPYILMNYQPEVLDHVFTLAHEAGHSMHSWYSAKNQPYEYYDYTIFVAEVASTFNEQLLSKRLMDQAGSDKERAYLINREIDAIRGTLVRQTMFAEFEKTTHAMAEAGEPLTLDSFKAVYRELLEAYFGPNFKLDDELLLECFRIPHFYRAFYVYKYATGISAAIALSERVLGGGPQELEDYLGFLKAGCSKYPLEILRDAGVDMEQPQPVETALKHFGRLVEELDQLL